MQDKDTSTRKFIKRVPTTSDPKNRGGYATWGKDGPNKDGYLYRAPDHKPEDEISSNAFIHMVPGQPQGKPAAGAPVDPELKALADAMGVSPQDLILFERMMRDRHGNQLQDGD